MRCNPSLGKASAGTTPGTVRRWSRSILARIRGGHAGDPKPQSWAWRAYSRSSSPNADDGRAGSINLYWRRPRCFQADDVAFAYIFARHAAVALEHSLELAGLNVALDGRKLIGQAQGILMERHGLDEKQAFEVLRRYSQDHNLKLRQVAEYLVSTRQLPDREDVITHQLAASEGVTTP